jgi:hypothetical protein
VVSYNHDTTGTDLTSMVWTPQTYTFQATTGSTTLSFISTTATAFGPAIDNVAVTETVAMKDDCKDGGWQTMLDTAGNSFKNQGDCVSFFATKGKNLGALPPATVPAAAATTDADSMTSSAKQSKKQEKATARQGTERQAKDKTKSHAGKGQGSKSHKSK